MKCNHEPNNKKNTLEFEKTKSKCGKFITAYCKECGESFIYEKKNGKFVEAVKR